jgi:prolyl-tRNA editing enzyme YbaK/EbsC (Cys-tRNA(Pro) deacylase)
MMDPKKAKEMQERARERNLIVREMRSQPSQTVEELSKTTGIEKSQLLKNLIAMRQFGKVQVVGKRDQQLTYSLVAENK